MTPEQKQIAARIDHLRSQVEDLEQGLMETYAEAKQTASLLGESYAIFDADGVRCEFNVVPFLATALAKELLVWAESWFELDSTDHTPAFYCRTVDHNLAALMDYADSRDLPTEVFPDMVGDINWLADNRPDTVREVLDSLLRSDRISMEYIPSYARKVLGYETEERELSPEEQAWERADHVYHTHVDNQLTEKLA